LVLRSTIAGCEHAVPHHPVNLGFTVTAMGAVVVVGQLSVLGSSVRVMDPGSPDRPTVPPLGAVA
jgi:hypothetical protein